MKKISTIFLTVFFLLAILVTPVNADSHTRRSTDPAQSTESNVLCSIFPFLESIESVAGLCGGEEAANESAEKSVQQIRGFVELGLSLIFVGIIAISIFVIIKAAVKYIRSEGDADKILEAQKAIKNVFMGIGALFVGIIGIIIILAFFQATGAVDDGKLETGNDLIDDNLLETSGN